MMYDWKNEIDMMKKIIFSKLWEYDTCYKVRKIYLQNKWCARVYMNQKWGSHERSFQILKDKLHPRSLNKGWVKGAIIME
jgi:hypothetical protein